ncbi:MAG: GNAT family N-acetyltransferase [Casimicrobiaceae bacterium]
MALMSRDLIETGLGWAYRTERIAKLIGDPEAVALVARDSPRSVGFAVMTFGDERAHLVLLAVHSTHHRRGIARRMIEWLLSTAAVAGIASIHVELRADNRPAYALYRALGFAETLRVPGYYRGRETAVRMIRLLCAPQVAAQTWRPPTRDKR